MLNNNSGSQQFGEKKKLPKSLNPFKAVTPKKKALPAGQTQLNFFNLSKSASNLGDDKSKDPLKPTSSSSLNRSSSTPNFFNPPKSKASLSQLSSGSFDEFDALDDDDFRGNEKPIANLKRSKPVGSLIPQTSKTSEFAQGPPARHIITPPTSNEGRQIPSGFKNIEAQRTSSNSSLKLGSQSKTKSGSNGFGQPTLNLGGKQLAPKRKTNPWDNTVVSTKRIKNPRIKETKSITSSSSRSYSSSSSSRIQLSEEQLKVIDIVVNERKNVFYTGSAGTGKSVLLKELVSRLIMKYSANAVAVTASTGLAAVNIGGVTINKFSGMGLAIDNAKAIAAKASKNQQTVQRWRRTKVLIIDEISMIDAAFLDKLEYVARYITKRDSEPFGGIQVVLTGDFFQLPPVSKNGPAANFCFQAQCWSRCIQKTILLKQVFRQNDNSFVDLLNSLRLGEVTDEMAKVFKSLEREVQYDDGIQPTELFCTRYEVEQANKKRLDQLPGMKREFIAKDIGSPQSLGSLSSVMAVQKLILKEDAQVMMLKNKDDTLVNGTVGKVIAFITSSLFTRFRTHHRDSDLNDEDTVKQLRMLSRCVSETEIPADVLQYANSISDRTGFMELATLALTESTVNLLPLIKFATVAGPRIELVEREDFVPEGASQESAASRSQFPLLLSWALSIHKSQGQTLDRVKVDLSRTFERGQVYVALSRAVSKDKLEIVNFKREKIQSSGVVKAFYSQLESL